jgi:hypothetical protein
MSEWTTHRISLRSIEPGMKIHIPAARRVIRVKTVEHGTQGTRVVSTEGVIYNNLTPDSEVAVVPAEGEVWA